MFVFTKKIFLKYVTLTHSYLTLTVILLRIYTFFITIILKVCWFFLTLTGTLYGTQAVSAAANKREMFLLEPVQ